MVYEKSASCMRCVDFEWFKILGVNELAVEFERFARGFVKVITGCQQLNVIDVFINFMCNWQGLNK